MKILLTLLTITITTALFVASCSSVKLTDDERQERDQQRRDERAQRGLGRQ